MNDDDHVDAAWRAEMLAETYGADRSRATEGLLSLTFHETDQAWIETELLKVVDADLDLQVRQLAVVCVGHMARLHRQISPRAVAGLHALMAEPDFSDRAENALGDVGVFVPEALRKSAADDH